MDDFIIQHPRGGAALLGLEQSQGSKMGPGLESEQGLKPAQTLRWGYWIERLLGRGTSEDRQARQRWVLLQTFHLTLSDLCHHLIYYQGGETEKEGPHEGKREADKERQHKASNSAFSLVATAQ